MGPAHVLVALLVISASARTVLVDVGSSSSSAAAYIPSRVGADMGDVVQFTWRIDRASVTFGDPVSCRPYAAPAPRVDSGVQTTGFVFAVNVTAAGGFEPNVVYSFFSSPQCGLNGASSFYGSVAVSSAASSGTIGIAVGLSVGFAFLACVVIVVAFFLRAHWARDPIKHV